MRSSTHTSSRKSSYLTQLYSFFIQSTTAEETVEETKLNNRKRYHFTTNKTSSLALPDEITKKESKCMPDASPGYTHYISSFFSSMASMVLTASPTLTTEEKEDSTTISDIHEKMRQLNQTYHKNKEDPESDKLLLEEVELVEEQIEEHAARRVDLFFYLLLAVYNKNVNVTKAKTVKQHGTGSKELGTQACHSSLFPNLHFEALPSSSWLPAWLRAAEEPLTLAETQFEDALNMTVELPKIVNDFDGLIEGRAHTTIYTLNCLVILNKVSKGEMTPKAGMNEFLKNMNDFFTRFEKECLSKKETSMAVKKIWEREKAGTFQAANPNSLTLNDDYLYLMLRMNPDEIKQVKGRLAGYLPSLFQDRLSDPLAPFYANIQKEILTSPPTKSHRGKRIKQ